MEKKKLLTFGILSFFAIALVTAGIVLYQGQFNDTINVYSPIEVIGLESNYLGEDSAGTTVDGTPFTMKNIEDFAVLVNVSHDAEEGIEVEYKGQLELTSKDISTWGITSDKKATIEYTIVGDSFSYEVISSSGFDLEDYTLIYYKDNDANANDEDRLITIGSNEDFSSNMPHEDDWNVGELANYCDNGYDNYNSCKGAKLWFVKTSDIVEGDLTWSDMANYLYETDLIQYNSEGEIIMYPGMFLKLTPEYTIDINFVGNTTVTNNVKNIALA